MMTQLSRNQKTKKKINNHLLKLKIMRFRNIFWGVILIFIGILFTLQNLGMLHFDWVSLWRLWPVFLVLWGVSIIPVKDFIKVLLVLVVLAGSMFFIINRTEFRDGSHPIEWFSNHDWDEWEDDYDDSGSSSKRYTTQTFDIPYNDSAKYVTLNMEAAAGKFTIDDTSVSLIDFNRRGNSAEYSYFITSSDSSSNINIEMESASVNFGKKHKNTVTIDMNNLPIWDINLDAGAAAIDFDFSDFKIRSLDVEGGAASINLVLGDEYDETNVTLESGASSVVIKVPESSGCKLSLESVLSSKELMGFEKLDRGEYETPNFDEAANKVYIDAEAAVSSFTIIRY